MIAFEVPGIPRPGGSKTSMPIYRKGGIPVIKNGRVITATVESGKYTATWRATIAAIARAAMPDGIPALTGPLKLRVVFTMPRPKHHYRSNGQLKPNAPKWHTSKPDATKLLRALEDACTEIVWKDDSQICDQAAIKPYGEYPGAKVLVGGIDEAVVTHKKSRQEIVNSLERVDPQSNAYAVPWAEQAIELQHQNQEEKSLDIIFDNIDEMLLASKFDECATMLGLLPIVRLTNAQLITVLTATLPAKGRLGIARANLFDSVKSILNDQGADAESILVGLD